jgi:hypothetical protein
LKAQAVQFNKLLGEDETFKASEGWLWRLKARHGICQFHNGVESPSCAGAAAKVFPEILRKATAEMASTKMKNCTTVTKQHCTTKCFQTNPQILKKHQTKWV